MMCPVSFVTPSGPVWFPLSVRGPWAAKDRRRRLKVEAFPSRILRFSLMACGICSFMMRGWSSH